ncbi:hypothetical protein H7F51_11530 [Novosphingobium flavum]|uniref:Putative zinc-finger domain-containing protein n=1 Tax=Novosphingobium flavum TaxID=1778672 RepID=A0A7X1KM12_9SPHN|nr:hypothetical protein [Novosphingobium flavum]MBC2666149.1 hypothetical protein [Novosphingobium flavum]
MTITPEQLAAYADGELDEAEARVVEAALGQNVELQAELAAHRALKARLAAHFAPVAEEAVPDHLAALLRAAPPVEVPAVARVEAEVIDFAAARAARKAAQAAQARPARARWPRWAGPALAASLVLAVLGIGLRPSGNEAGGALGAALDRQLAAGQSGSEPVRILISFRDKAGTLCRGYAEGAGSGIACHVGGGWKVIRQFGGAAAEQGQYRQAGSASEQVFAAAQDLAEGEALDEQGERTARAAGWSR